MANLQRDNGLRVNEVFAETDMAVMHTYPMYTDWAGSPLDPDVVPYTCAMRTALCGKPVLMEECGGCTTPPGEPSQVWEWEGYGRQIRQFLASEDDMAAYVAAVLPRLVAVGATGAMLWCFADSAPTCGMARPTANRATSASSGWCAPTARSSRMPRCYAGSPRPTLRSRARLRSSWPRWIPRHTTAIPAVCWSRGTRASARRLVEPCPCPAHEWAGNMG